jgi:alanyl-tRNA synthetase
MQAAKVLEKYISFFKKQGHLQIPNSPLVPENDPTTLFTSSGMQPLVPFLLGEVHPLGKRLVNAQNCFRAQDIDEVGDNRHTTFFRMLGNWSLGDYFKKEQLPWVFAFLTKELGIDPKKLYVTAFEGFKDIPKDDEALNIWQEIFREAGIDPKDRISTYGVTKNWWSRSGVPDNMPAGEPGGPDSEVFYDYGKELKIHEKSIYKNDACHVNCDCGRYLEIGNSVFMQYQKQQDGSFKKLSQQNVDFGGGLERLVAVTEGKQDVFATSLFSPIIKTIEKLTGKEYAANPFPMRIITDHLVSAVFIANANVIPSNKEQGYILRRLIRRATDNLLHLNSKYEDVEPILESVVTQYKETNPILVEKFETIKNTILEEQQKYKKVQDQAREYIIKKYPGSSGDELKGVKEISVDDAFLLYTSHGLSPTQIRSLGYVFDEQAFAEKMKEHQNLSRKGAGQKFTGGLSDHQERTVMGHTATHLLHQALRDVLGSAVRQTGSNITTERVRFDFNFDRKLTDEEAKKVAEIVNDKIKANLPVHFDLLPLQEAKQTGAIGLFDDKYADHVKVYFIGGYSKELCGGPHVDFTSELKSFKIIKQENIGNKQRRIYAVVG